MNYAKKQKDLVEKIKKDLSADKTIGSTVVEIKQDYENDEALCLTSAVFPLKIITDIIVEKIIEPLKSIDNSHYYFPSQSLHLTIKNIRIIHNPPSFNEEDVKKVDVLFKKIVPKFNFFRFSLKDLVIFPTSLSLIGYTDDSLQKLVLELDKGLKSIGVPDNKKYVSDKIFFGNITLCRFTHEPTELFLKKVKELENIVIGEVLVKEILLIISNCVCNAKSRRIINAYSLV